MIRQCTEVDFDKMLIIINQAAEAYRNTIPSDCWHEPYMSSHALAAEISSGVNFWGYFESDVLIGVMGIQQVKNATLIRHAYVLSEYQGKSIGGQLLNFLIKQAGELLLVGTWAAATWAIRFYEHNGFKLVNTTEKDRLLGVYWNISLRQTETSVVLRHGY
jgi:GNAT superfamily N-acetyltransferase